MYKHIFALGLALISIYTTTAMAALPTKSASGIWTNSGHTTLATLRCDSCCKTTCWLPTGTYYDEGGTFSNTCGSEPTEPLPCTTSGGVVYFVVNGSCQEKSACNSNASDELSRTYDIGAGVCVPVPQMNVRTATYDTMTWTTPIVVNSSTTVTVSGAARCTSTDLGGAYAVANNSYSPTGSGRYCVCRMTSVNGNPNIFSRWVQRNDFTDASTCSSQCPKYCSGKESNTALSWCAMFGSVEIN